MAHIGVTDEQYAQLEKMPKLMALYKKGLEFIESQKTAETEGSIIQFNKNLFENAPVLGKFMKKVEEKDLKTFDEGFFAFHGTSEAGVKGICKDGMDPARRASQVYGPGEYLNPTSKVASYHLKARSHHMIVAFVINGDHVNVIPNYCYVVRNPEDFQSTYVLPIFVMSYFAHQPFEF